VRRFLFLALPLYALNVSAHLIVDVRMSITAPQFVSIQQSFTYRVTADDLANDNAYGVVVTTVLPASVKFSNVVAEGFRCNEAKLTVTCSAEQIGPGANPIDITVVAPSSAELVIAKTTVQTIGSYDPNPNNDSATNAVVIYEPKSCTASAPLLSSPDEESSQPGFVPLAWSTVPGAQKYTIYTAVEGALAGPALVTDRAGASLIAEPGRTAWWVEASFTNCPSLVSSKRHFTVTAVLPRSVVDYAGRRDVDQTRDGPRTEATFRTPFGLALSPDGNLYVSDEVDHVVRRVTSSDVAVITGAPGLFGANDGQFARFYNPRGLTVTPIDGYIFAADMSNDEIRILYTGGPFVPAFVAGGQAQIAGYADDYGDRAKFNAPSGVAATERGTIYVADTQNHVIRKMTPIPATIGAFVVSTAAGVAGDPGSANGASSAAHFRAPLGVAVDNLGIVYVADSGNQAVRKIANGVVSTLATVTEPTGIAVDSRGNVFVTNRGDNAVRRIAPSGLATTIATGFNAPAGIAVDATGQIYVADSGNHMIRVIPLATAPTPPRHRAASH
jgi:uncharacterized protein DUF11/NHL repeat-containing protein